MCKTLKILHEFLFSSAWKEEVEPAERLTDVFTSCSLLMGLVFGEHYLDKKKCLFIGGVLMKLTDANIRGFFSRTRVPRMEIWRCPFPPPPPQPPPSPVYVRPNSVDIRKFEKITKLTGVNWLIGLSFATRSHFGNVKLHSKYSYLKKNLVIDMIIKLSYF